MGTHLRMLGMALVMAAALSFLAAPTAGANRSVSIEGAERGVAASGVLTFGETRLESESTFSCSVTLLSTVSRVVLKTIGTSLGKITGIAIDTPNCRAGALIGRVEGLTFLRETESSSCREIGGGVTLCDLAGGRAERWNRSYQTFTGTLPAITGVLFSIQRAQFLIRSTGFGTNQCLYEGNIGATTAIERGVVRQWSLLLASTRLPLIRRLAGIFCTETMTISGVLRLTPEYRIRLV